MRKVIFVILIFLSVLVIAIRLSYKPIVDRMGITGRAGVRIEANAEATVYINEHAVGKTPYQDEILKEGEYLVELKKDGEASESADLTTSVLWRGYVTLHSGTLTVVNREVSDTQAASSGEVITLEKGQGATVISTPEEAEVTVDGQVIGRTPIAIPDLSVGEHQFLISKENFLKRSIRATLIEGYNLHLAVDLAISEADLTKVPTIPITETQQVIVKGTPVGFLRVRADSTTNAQEVARVNPGDTLTLLEEKPSWQRVRLPDGKEGWVSSAYTEKKTP